IRQFTKKYSPFSKYAGLFIARADENSEYIKVDENSTMKLISVDPSGEATSDQLQLMVYKMEWRWWWESSDQNIGSYISRNNASLVLSKTGDINSAPVTVREAFSKLEWGRYLIVVQSTSGHTCSQTVYNRPDYYYEDQSSSQATMLSFTSDKKKYTAGDNIHISFPAPDKGRALITIENGTSVTDKFWVNTTAGNNDLKIKATEAMAPCAYIHISLIQPFGQRNNDNPIRMYGVIPIPVENPGSRLFPVLQIPAEFRPERQISLSVSEKNGKAMNYTIAMVDEGLLDLTGFNTPDPWTGIYQREALGVKTWDLFDDVLGAFGGKIEKLFAIGGDMNPVDPSKNKANRFKPVVRFAGPFRIEKGQTRKHTLDIPAYSGSVRTMIIAGNEGSYGTAEKTSAVKSPLMLLPVAPRSLGFDEEITIPVSVFAQDAALKNVRVKIECSEHFSILSAKETSLNFTEIGEKSVEFRIKTSEMSGFGTISFTATSG
ncbi:MAG: alpha-2-macroglobulin family protein, partial [Bacteroidota bacterium]|nr:alpha-2-macroglobulin family protein [Bacteroidota bacterium]